MLNDLVRLTQEISFRWWSLRTDGPKALRVEVALLSSRSRSLYGRLGGEGDVEVQTFRLKAYHSVVSLAAIQFPVFDLHTIFKSLIRNISTLPCISHLPVLVSNFLFWCTFSSLFGIVSPSTSVLPIHLLWSRCCTVLLVIIPSSLLVVL